MEFLNILKGLFENFTELTDWKQPVMWLIGAILIYLAIKKQMEPTLLLPLGFGAILVNIPNADAIKELVSTPLGTEGGPLSVLFEAGINIGELFPLLHPCFESEAGLHNTISH